MSDEHFLARWSRRKQEAKPDYVEPAPEQAVEAGAPAPADPVPAVPALAQPDLSNLPPIESIDAATDITAFLRKGIPLELSRAALRRAWSADPAIRDFVGLAENAWDFNDPNAMSGFGPLDYSAERVGALAHRIVGGVAEAAESLANPSTEGAEEAARPADLQSDFGPSSGPVKAITNPQRFGERAVEELPAGSAAPQPAAARDETSVPRRAHGGALPR
ncbi:DUF3306 domain-containing protein [Bradyrhizobium acaciae]|uniref:DUF3306 domain-containing protein n=1 Tax=Bradyrhizobium acaciae TaxID=2683706 RepID=UPI001E5AD98C|nr:DUF3306 domain-containing protein [Bradyrhizobium acaciae]MCC8977365.1 DUF3306 domain-containing protein [Bradyrhizobium acaciae]